MAPPLRTISVGQGHIRSVLPLLALSGRVLQLVAVLRQPVLLVLCSPSTQTAKVSKDAINVQSYPGIPPMGGRRVTTYPRLVCTQVPLHPS